MMGKWRYSATDHSHHHHRVRYGKEGEFTILWTSELKHRRLSAVVKLIKLMCLPPPYHIETNSKYFHFVEPRALT